MNRTSAVIHHLFQTGDTAVMLCVSRKTIQRWAKKGKMVPQTEHNNRYLFSLDEINRLRETMAHPPLTVSQAIMIHDGAEYASIW